MIIEKFGRLLIDKDGGLVIQGFSTRGEPSDLPYTGQRFLDDLVELAKVGEREKEFRRAHQWATGP